MAILSELAYTRLDQDDNNYILSLAKELAQLSEHEQIVERLQNLAKLLSTTRDGMTTTDNELLRSALAAGGYRLKGVLFDAGTDTQGYVAVRRPKDGPGMAVLVFRGTQQTKDWITNLNVAMSPVTGSNGEVLGNVHRGFHAAFRSVHNQIGPLLKGDEDLPLFITGHSLGGALATLATWYLKGDSLAACYTFGAPRVGDSQLMSRFRTPIYRLVNGVDPVPFVPASDKTVSFIKHVLRFVGTVIAPAEKLADALVKCQGYRHYGYQRYINICSAGQKGDFPGLQVEYAVSPMARILRLLGRMMRREFTRGVRYDKYHKIDLYRAKLRVFAIKRQQQLRISIEPLTGKKRSTM